MESMTTAPESDVEQTLPDIADERASRSEELRIPSDDGEVDVVRTTVKAAFLMQRC